MPNKGMEVDWEKRAFFSLLCKPSKSHFFYSFHGCSKLSQPLMPGIDNINHCKDKKMDEKEAFNLRYLEAKAVKEELLAQQLQADIDAKTQKKVRFYNSPLLLRSVVTGVTLAILFAGYFQYLFVPKQQKMQGQLDTAAFVGQQKEAMHKTETARSKFIQEKLKEQAKSTSMKLDAAIASFKKVQEQNAELQLALAELPKKNKDDNKIKKLTAAAERSGQKISSQLVAASEALVKVEGISEAISARKSSIEGDSGWIYVGYYPNDIWNFKNISTKSGLPIINRTYDTINDINVRDRAPKFTLFGYSFGDLLGKVVSGQKIKVLQVKEVGRDKVWAKIELVQ